MSRPKKDTPRLPGYRLHKASGQAVVTLSGRDFYLGPHDTKASKREYDRVVGEWQANGRRLPAKVTAAEEAGPTVTELAVAYWKHAAVWYRKDGKPTTHQTLIKAMIREVRELYGPTFTKEFGPHSFRAVREGWIERGLSRATCNKYARAARAMFAWGVEHGMVPPVVDHALRAVKALQKGRTLAKERPPVLPVPDDDVQAVVNAASPTIAAMVTLQHLAGMRPAEVCLVRGREIVRRGDVWEFRPPHKMEHMDKERVILFGPRAQQILAPWIEGDPDRYAFHPRNRDWKPGLRYGPQGYAAAVRDVCKRIGITPFGVNRLRHACATRIRETYGLEAAQCVLGHARADVTELYAERNLKKAAEAMAALG